MRTDDEEESPDTAQATPVGLQHAGMIQVPTEVESEVQNEEDYAQPPSTPLPTQGKYGKTV